MFRQYEAYAFAGGLYKQHSGITPVGMGSLAAEPNYEVRPRVMKDYYLVYLSEGAGELRSEGRTFPLRAGDLYVLFPGVVHAYRTDPDDLIRMFWIGFSGADVPELVETARFSNPLAGAFITENRCRITAGSCDHAFSISPNND